MKNTLKVKKNYSIIIAVIILISTLFMSVGYATMNSVTLDITGTANATAQSGVFITNVECLSNNGADTASSTINNYYQTVLDSTMVLGSSSSSNITYRITLCNNSSKEYAFAGTVYADNFYDNSNIKFDLTGLEENDIIAANGGTIIFTITFSYVGTNTTNNTLHSYLNFKFGISHTVTYLNFGENSYPTVVIDGETYTNTFTSAPATISVTMSGIKLTTDQYTYSNGTLTIANVTGNLEIRNNTENLIIYESTEGVEFTGSNYIDTGAKLFSEANIDRNFKITFVITEDNQNQSAYNTLVSIMDESGAPYPGFLFRIGNSSRITEYELTANSIAGKGKAYYNYRSDVEKIEICRINRILYARINDGKYEQMQDYNAYTNYFDVPLTIGASLNSAGKPFRYFIGTLSNIEVKYLTDDATLTILNIIDSQ